MTTTTEALAEMKRIATMIQHDCIQDAQLIDKLTPKEIGPVLGGMLASISACAALLVNLTDAMNVPAEVPDHIHLDNFYGGGVVRNA